MQTVAKSCVAVAGTYCGMGLNVPIAPTIVAIVAVLMVRFLIWTSTRSLRWNVTLCGLAMLAAFVTVEGSTLNVFKAFWVGVGYGAMGVTIIEFGSGVMNKALTERFSNAFQVLFNIKSKSDS